jgi:hypothetical protein
MKKLSLLAITITTICLIFTAKAPAALINIETMIYSGQNKDTIYSSIIGGTFIGTNIYTEPQLSYGNGSSIAAIFHIQERASNEDIFINRSYLQDGTLEDLDQLWGEHWSNANSWIEAHQSGEQFIFTELSFYPNALGVTRLDFSWLGNNATTGITHMYLAGTEPSAAPVPEPATMFLIGTGLLALAGTGRFRKTKTKP